MLAEGEHAGYQWAVIHNGMGYRCGYVRVPKGHPWHGKGCDELYELSPDIEAHGGLTFAAPDVECDAPGEDNAWWLGFDCAHCGDAPDPALPNKYSTTYPGDTVKSQCYVEAECRSLCEQAALAEEEG